MDPRPGTLVLDDGELGDVRATLDQLGVAYTYLRGGSTDGIAVDLPTQLLIATPRRAVRLAPGERERSDGPVRIVVAEQDSVSMRNQLRSLGVDYLVRRPIHPGALRLLLLRALYRGPERRVSVRYPIGGPVYTRTGLRKRSGMLLEISLRGARVSSDAACDPDTRISLILPKDFTTTRTLTLAGWVVRCQPVDGVDGVDGADGADAAQPGFEVAIAFEALTSGTERELRSLMKRKIQNLGDDDAGAPARVDERRAGRRAAFPGAVNAVRDEAARTLVGRNLSTGGLLVEQNLDLRIGDETTLEIFERRDGDPLRVRARVVRDDDAGMALQFVDVPDDVAGRLEALVAGLPPIERLADSEAEAMGTVVAGIVPDPSDPSA